MSKETVTDDPRNCSGAAYGSVSGRPATCVSARLFRGGVLAFDQLRNAEVEQLRLPVRRDEDVARLDVAMNDEPRVRVGHRAHDRQEEVQQ